MREARENEFSAIVDQIGDTPHTTIAVHALLCRRCRAWAGARCAVVRADYIPAEPYAFGDDAERLADTLAQLQGWTAVSVDESAAETLHVALSHRLQFPLLRADDLYYEQRDPVAVVAHPLVRQLTLADFDLLISSPERMQGGDPVYARRLLEEGLIVAAIVEGRIGCTMHSYCRTPCFADIGANTLPEFRRRGFALAAGLLLCRLLRERNLTPTWSTGGENIASQQLAAGLGFSPLARRIYLVPDRPK